MMSLARPLADSARAQTPRYQLPAITWLLISLLPQPLQDFRKAALPPRLRFLSLFNSGLVWTKWVWLKECVGLCQSGIAGFPLPICPCLFFSFSFFFFCFSTPFNQTERMRRLYPRWLHAGVHLNWICLVLGWLILGGRPFTAAGLSQTTQTRWPRLKFQVRIRIKIWFFKIYSKGK